MTPDVGSESPRGLTNPGTRDEDVRRFENLRAEAAIMLQTKKYSEAVDCARRAILIRPDDPRPYGQIALALACLKDTGSTNWAQKAISLEPNNGYWYATLADTYTLRGEPRRAIKPLEKAISLSPVNPSFQSALGVCLLQRGRLKKALPYLQKAVELNPQSAIFHMRLSVGLWQKGDKDGAEQHLNKALELKPDNPRVQVGLGMRLLMQGKQRESGQAFQEALRLDPELQDAKVGLGLATTTGFTALDRVFHYTLSLTTQRRRQVIGLVSMIISLEFLLAVPGSTSWPLSVVTAMLLGWLIYFTFSWRIAKTIGKWRSSRV